MGRLIAIGDIHGHALALRALLEVIGPRSDDTIVPLGDVIDRGPDSKGVLETLLELRSSCTVVPIMGNHEEMMLAATKSSVELRSWVEFGGAETLDSYGAGGRVELIAKEHVDFVREFHSYHESDTHIFLHANYEPDLPLHQQSGRTLRWDFVHHRLPGPHCSGKTVIVGHSPQKTGEILDLGYVLCIETNVVGGGWLTALDVHSGRVWQADMEGRVRE